MTEEKKKGAKSTEEATSKTEAKNTGKRKKPSYRACIKLTLSDDGVTQTNVTGRGNDLIYLLARLVQALSEDANCSVDTVIGAIRRDIRMLDKLDVIRDLLEVFEK